MLLVAFGPADPLKRKQLPQDWQNQVQQAAFKVAVSDLGMAQYSIN